MTDDLVERVAREIYDHFDAPLETGLHRARKAEAIRLARAAIRIALEEAAKVADAAEKRDAQAAREPCDEEERAAFQRGAFMSRNIAAAIRAMIKEER